MQCGGMKVDYLGLIAVFLRPGDIMNIMKRLGLITIVFLFSAEFLAGNGISAALYERCSAWTHLISHTIGGKVQDDNEKTVDNDIGKLKWEHNVD